MPASAVVYGGRSLGVYTARSEPRGGGALVYLSGTAPRGALPMFFS